MFGQSLLSAFGSAACTTDTDQLFTTDVQTTSVATYQLNNATTSIPSNTYPGTPSNITYAAGKFGNAAVFNGSSSKIDTDADFSGSTATGATISFWFKTSNTSGQTILGSQTGNPSGFAYGSQIYLGNSFSGIPDESIAFINERSGFTESFLTREGSTAYADGNWHHAVFISTNSTKQIWIDGVSKTVYYYQSGSATAQADLTDIALGTSLSASWFNGSIDQVRIFNSALPQAAVTALYNETTTTATYDYVDYQLANPNSIAYYKMSDATDQLGNYNGTAGNVNFNTEGKFGFAGYFNGSDSYVSLPAGINKNNNFSWSFWINFTSMTQYDTPIGFFMNGSTNFIDMLSVGTLSFYDGNSRVTTPSSTFVTGGWYHIAVTKSSTAGRKFYVNGLEVASDSVNTNSGGTTGGRNLFGAYSSGGNPTTAAFALDGKMDQIRIYDSALSAANVTTLYNEIECPAVAVTNAFNTVLYNGNGGTQAVTGVGFKPDFVWIKARNGGYYHILQDSVRGAGSGKSIYSNGTEAEGTYVGDGYTDSFQSNGFTVAGGSSTALQTNGSGVNYVSWNWKAGGTAVSNTDGTTTSQVSANTNAGFSIVSYSGTGANATVGHGLSSAPQLILQKRYEAAANWFVYSQAIGNTKYINLDATAAAGSAVNVWNNTDPTDKVFSVSSFFDVNGSGISSIAYCFTSIPGYSRVGSYIGNGSTTGPIIYTGFRPRFIMTRPYSIGDNWSIWGVNQSGDDIDQILVPNNSAAQSAIGFGRYDITLSSTGFQLKRTDSQINQNGAAYIFMAIA